MTTSPENNLETNIFQDFHLIGQKAFYLETKLTIYRCRSLREFLWRWESSLHKVLQGCIGHIRPCTKPSKLSLGSSPPTLLSSRSPGSTGSEVSVESSYEESRTVGPWTETRLAGSPISCNAFSNAPSAAVTSAYEALDPEPRAHSSSALRTRTRSADSQNNASDTESMKSPAQSSHNGWARRMHSCLCSWTWGGMTLLHSAGV